jgi:hypothetical protein
MYITTKVVVLNTGAWLGSSGRRGVLKVERAESEPQTAMGSFSLSDQVKVEDTR